MMKRKLVLELALCLCLGVFLAGCGEEEYVEPYNYDMSEYIKLGQYKGVEIEVSDKVINGDTVNIDFVGKVDGEVFEGGSTDPASGGYNLTIGSGNFIPGFEEGLVGAAEGETVVLDLTFPENYGKEELNGKPVEFTVTVNSIDKETSQRNAIWNKVLAETEVLGYPETELEKAKQSQYEMYENYAKASGMELADFLKQSGMTQEDYDKYVDSYAKMVVDMEMTLYAIADTEKISISDEEYKKGIEELIKKQGYEDEAAFKKANQNMGFEEYVGRDNIMTTLLLEKVMDVLMKEAVLVPAADAKDETPAE